MLPKIMHPTFKIELPILKKKYEFRPFLVKEEKILLMAKESDDNKDILSAIRQIVNNCSVSKDFDVDKLSICDLEYIFIKLRAMSIDNIINLSYIDNEDNKQYNFQVDLNDVEIFYSEKVSEIIKIDDESGIIMSYPKAKLYEDSEFLSIQKDYMFELILRCIESIYQGEEIYKAAEHSKEELVEFLESLEPKIYIEIEKYLKSMPTIRYIIKYKNSFDNDRTIELSSLNDFFTFR